MADLTVFLLRAVPSPFALVEKNMWIKPRVGIIDHFDYQVFRYESL